MARFSGKVVIVTGAASGIGEGAARRFAAEDRAAWSRASKSTPVNTR